MTSALAALALVTLHAFACGGLGVGAARLLGVDLARRDDVPLSLRAATAWSLGAGVLAAAWLALALAGTLSPPVVMASGALAALAGGRASLRLLRSARAALRREREWALSPAAPLRAALVALLLVTIAAHAVASLGPPIGDALAFYMVLAKLVAATGRLVPLPGYEEFSQIHLFGELHFAALYSLGAEAAAKASAMAAALVATLGLWGLGAQLGLGRPGRWIALAIAWCSSAFTFVVSDGKVDVFAAALGIVAVGWAVRCARDDAAAAARVCGFLAGCAVVAKISYAVSLVPCIALIVALLVLRASSRDAGDGGGRGAWRRLAGAAGWCAALAALAVLPQLAKNALLFGAPLAPFVGVTLGATSMLSGSSWLNQAWLSPAAQRRLVAAYPLALVFGSFPMQYGNLSALALAFAPLALALRAARRAFRGPLGAVTLGALAGLALFVALRPSVLAPRYYLAPLLLLAFAPAAGAERALRGESACLRAAVVLALLLGLGSALGGVTGAWSAARAGWAHVAGGPPDDPLRRAADVLAARAPEGSRVLFAIYERYWFRPDLLGCASRDADLRTLDGARGPALWEALHRGGFGFVVIGRGFQVRDASGGLSALGDAELRAEGAPGWLVVDEIHREETVRVLAIGVRPERAAKAPPVERACRREGRGWSIGATRAPTAAGGGGER